MSELREAEYRWLKVRVDGTAINGNKHSKYIVFFNERESEVGAWVAESLLLAAPAVAETGALLKELVDFFGNNFERSSEFLNETSTKYFDDLLARSRTALAAQAPKPSGTIPAREFCLPSVLFTDPAPKPSTGAVGYECGCPVEQAQQLKEGKFFYPYCPRHKKPLKRAAATASTGAQVKCPKCESTMVSVIYECDMCQTEFEYVPASLSAGGLTDDVREIYDPDEFDYMCANGHRKIQLRQQDGLGCPLCALATAEHPDQQGSPPTCEVQAPKQENVAS
jgi:hypothetical protein